MKRLLFALFAAASSLLAADLSTFNGTWVVKSAEVNGDTAGDGFDAVVLTLKDGKYVYESNDGTAKGKFTVDFSKTPATMDATETEGQNVGNTIAAIVELTADGWRANYAFGGGARPTEFKTSQDSGFVLVSYKRKPGTEEPAVKPIRALLLAGGCCHDYAKQKDILKTGLEARANVQVDIIYTPDSSTKPPLPIYGNPDYANGYDVVIHDECGSDVSEPEVIEGVLKPHRDGIAAMNLHCAMHCYRIGNPNEPAKAGTPHAFWFDYLGLQSSGHGAQKPITITFLDSSSPITKGLSGWTTINEELYNNIQLAGTTKPLARGKQDGGDRPGYNDTTVVWTHEYGAKKTRVFSTTIGHNNATVADDRYLDLVARGLLWSTKHLNDDGTPATGYGPRGK